MRYNDLFSTQRNCPKFTTALALLAGAAQLHNFASNGWGTGELIIKYREDVTAADIQRGVENARLQLLEYVQTAPMAWRGQIGLVTAYTDLHTDLALEILRNDPAIKYAEVNARITSQLAADDEYFLDGQMWWGAYGTSGTPSNSFGSQVAEAWAAGYVGSHSIAVAVLDDGIQITHPELAPNIWINPQEEADGLDNDGNDLDDDIHGWNFVEGNNIVFVPEYNTGGGVVRGYHGTLVAGIIGAVGGNGVGIAGINWEVTMVPVRILEPDGSGSITDAVQAIDYCVDLKQRGVNIVAINGSWGSDQYSQSLHSAVIRAAKAGILFVAAAGNGPIVGNVAMPGTDNDTQPFWPANIDTTVGTDDETPADYNSVISVAAIDKFGAIAEFSNFGSAKVHLAAPGVQIISTYPNNTYATAQGGTSQAAPHVTGALALYASTHPNATAEQIRTAILGAVEPTESLDGKASTGGRLNLSTVIIPAAVPEATVVGRYLFYNASAWDGNDAGATASDDNAIATDKSALLPGGSATFANYSSYTRGINGIMIDIADLADPEALSASDFTFKVGNNSTPSGWANGPAPSSITVRQGAGAGGSDRVTLIWANNAIQKQWLQVTVLATENTGLPDADVFYFGNAIGESGNSALNAQVNLADEIGARNNPRSILNPAPIDNAYDYNRDRRVNLADEISARNNSTSLLSALRLIQPQ